MSDKLFIDNLIIDTIIGVHNWERQLKQRIELDIILQLAHNKAAKTDQLSDALDYDALCTQLTAFVSELNCQLIETLAEKIADYLLTHTLISSLTLTLRKPGAVKQAQCIGITIKRDK